MPPASISPLSSQGETAGLEIVESPATDTHVKQAKKSSRPILPAVAKGAVVPRKRSNRTHKPPEIFDPSRVQPVVAPVQLNSSGLPKTKAKPIPKKQQLITKYCQPGAWVKVKSVAKSNKAKSPQQFLGPCFHKTQFKWNFKYLKDNGLTEGTGSSKTINLSFLRLLWSHQTKLKRQEDDFLNQNSKGGKASQMALNNQLARTSKIGARVIWRPGSFFQHRGPETPKSLTHYPQKLLLSKAEAATIESLCKLLEKTSKRMPSMKPSELYSCMQAHKPHPGAKFPLHLQQVNNFSQCEAPIPKKSPTMEASSLAMHAAISTINVGVNMDSPKVMLTNMKYTLQHRPETVRLIVLFESPGYTSPQEQIPEHMLAPRFRDCWDFPILDYTNAMYCPTYGERCAMVSGKNCRNTSGPNSFWKTAAALAGMDPVFVLKQRYPNNDKGIRQRLKYKSACLAELKRRHIWMVDVSQGAVYMQEKQLLGFGRNGQIQRFSSDACIRLRETLIVGWEYHTKLLVEKAASEGHLKAVVPMCNRVVNSLSRDRIQNSVGGLLLPAGCPHPNAWTCAQTTQPIDQIKAILDMYSLC